MVNARSALLLALLGVACGDFPGGPGTDLKRLLVHREGPKHTNPNGPCSTMIHVPREMPLEELRMLVSEKLSFPAGRFALDGKELGDIDAVPEGSLLQVYEASSTAERTAESLRHEAKVPVEKPSLDTARSATNAKSAQAESQPAADGVASGSEEPANSSACSAKIASNTGILADAAIVQCNVTGLGQ
eukprot:CAMPEP_0172870682 /NCGR_PEP_ID=MMETSP1075-20121228/91658_1 /TAXON_ID=2916 /ORGANISM="Ceratium fusus, Strain PA161109" /LENGTH=187 /DNA_ID=CAMNT_0013720839 /DNA_START=46 /DNA_END=606 /DNA_ORIENTATION=-